MGEGGYFVSYRFEFATLAIEINESLIITIASISPPYTPNPSPYDLR